MTDELLKVVIFIMFAVLAGILFATAHWACCLQCLTICIIIGCSWDIEKAIRNKRGEKL